MQKNLVLTTKNSWRTALQCRQMQEEMMAAKTKDVKAPTNMIEEKLTRIGDLRVDIQQMKNDLSDIAEGLGEDKTSLADVDKNCEAQTKMYKENDDDALELFCSLKIESNFRNNIEKLK